jgi:hypothetical protein
MMRRWGMVLIGFLLCGLGLVSCNERRSESRPPQRDSFTVQVLADGRKIRVMAIRRDDHLPRSIGLDYVTEIPLSDHVRLQQEVRLVWSTFFHKDADEMNATRAYVFARQIKLDQRKATDARETGFVYVRNADGKWMEAGGFSGRDCPDSR